MHARRNPYPDILKGMAILLVILGHCIQFGSGSAYEAGAFFQSNPLFIWIYSFHMPLFMILAGYFTAGSLQRYTGTECIVRRIRSLVIPILAWSVVYEIYAWGSMLLRGEPLQVSTLPGAWLQYFSSSQWFLWAVFWYTVILAAGRRLGRYSIVLYILLSLCTCWINVPGNFCNLDTYITNWPLFLTGYLTGEQVRTGWTLLTHPGQKPSSGTARTAAAGKSEREKEKERDSRVWLEKPAFLVPCVALYGALLCWQLTEKPQLLLLPYRIYYILTGISGSVTVAAIVLFLYKKTASRGQSHAGVWHVLSLLGQKTMGIYIISGYLCTEILRKVPVSTYHTRIALLEMAGILFASVVMMSILERIPWTRKWLLGTK